MTDALPVSEYAFPGPLRDALVASILLGEKTTTTSLRQEYELEGEPLPRVGDRARVIDSQGRTVCIEEITDVREVRLGDVVLRLARDEGEGYRTVAEWRHGHEGFWHGDEYRTWIGDPAFTVDDSTIVVLVRFTVHATQ